MNDTLLHGSLRAGGLSVPAELVSPPDRPWNHRALLWGFTLLSFLGGAYIGYLYRTTEPPIDPQLTVVHSGGKLVARWKPVAPAQSPSGAAARLRVRSGPQDTSIPLNSTALQLGELALNVDPTRAADVALLGDGISSNAHFLGGEPLDTALLRADTASLRLQIAEQRARNAQAERRLTQRF